MEYAGAAGVLSAEYPMSRPDPNSPSMERIILKAVALVMTVTLIAPSSVLLGCVGCNFTSESTYGPPELVRCDSYPYQASDKWNISGTWTTMGGGCVALGYDSTFSSLGCTT